MRGLDSSCLVLFVACSWGCKDEGKLAPASVPASAPAPASEPAPTVRQDGPREPSLSVREPFERPVLEKTERGFTIDIARKAGATVPMGRVPFTAEPYVMWLQHDAHAELVEADILGTGLVLDLDGNGDTEGRVAVQCLESSRLRVGDREIPALVDEPGGPMRYRQGARSAIARLGDAGASLIAYSACRDGATTIGLAPGEMAIRQTPGAALQVMVFEVAPNSELPEPMALEVSADGKAIPVDVLVGLDSEPIFGADVTWTAMHWLMLPLSSAPSQRFEVRLPAAKGKRIASARVNLSGELDVRFAMSPGVLEMPAQGH